jgi:hypothetical protein
VFLVAFLVTHLSFLFVFHGGPSAFAGCVRGFS